MPLTTEHQPATEMPPQPSDAYHRFMEVLQTLPEPNQDLFGKRSQLLYTAYAEFLLNSEGPGEISWLSHSYQGRPLLGEKPCATLPFPTDWQKWQPRHEVEKQHSFVNIPYLPDAAMFQKLPDSDWQPTTPLEKYLRSLVETVCIDQFFFHGQQHDPIYKEILRRPQDSTEGKHRLHLSRQYLSWVFGTSVRGVDVTKATRAVPELTHIFMSGEIIKFQKSYKKAETLAIIPIDEEVDIALSELNNFLRQTEDQIIEDLDHDRPLLEYGEKARYLSENFQRIILVLRWRIEHLGSSMGTEELLSKAYFGLMRVMTFINYPQHSTTQDHFFQGIGTLLTGARADSFGTDPLIMPPDVVDYFDTFMAVAATLTVANFSKIRGRNILCRAANGGGRPLFATHQLPLDTPEQILATLTVLSLKMPAWQRQTYSEIINSTLRSLHQKIPPNGEKTLAEPTLVITNGPGSSVSAPFPFDLRDSAQAATWIHLCMAPNLAEPAGSIGHLMSRRPTGRLEVQLPPHMQIGGHDSNFFTVDADGLVVTAKEAQTKQPQKREEPLQTTQPETFLLKLARAPEVLSRRLGETVSKRILEMLRRDEDSGSIQAVAKLTVLLEKLLGKKLSDQKTDFIDILMQLGLLNTELTDISSVSETDLQALLHRCQNAQASTQDLDVTTGLIFLFATTNLIPRELLVELVFHSLESLEKLTVIEAIAAIEELDQNKLAFLFKRKEKKPSPILQWRDELSLIASTGKKQQGEAYQALEDPVYIAKAQKIVVAVTKLLHHTRSYDLSMSSTIMAVLTAKDQKRLVTRCAVDGQLLTGILRLISPELVTYYASTYGPEATMDLADWYHWLQSAAESGASSHGYNQSEYVPQVTPITQVADATGNFEPYLLSSHQVEALPKITAAMKFGKASLNHVAFFEGQKVLGHCVRRGQGSSLICDLALEADQILHAENADPDELRVLSLIFTDDQTPREERLRALDTFLTLEPKELAFGLQADYAIAGVAHRLETVIMLAQSSGRFGAFCFACNILRYAGFLPQELRQKGEALYQQLLTDMSTLDQPEIEAILAQSELFTRADRQAILTAHQMFQAELQRKLTAAATDPEIVATLAQELRSETKKHCQAAIAADLVEVASLTTQLDLIEQEAKARRQVVPFGEIASNTIHAETAARSHHITHQASLGTTVSETELFLETLTPKLGQKALKALTSDPDGRPLTGEALAQQVARLHAVIARTAYELARRQIATQTGIQPDSLTSLASTRPLLEATAQKHAALFAQGLSANAQTLGLILPDFNFTEVSLFQLPLGAVEPTKPQLAMAAD